MRNFAILTASLFFSAANVAGAQPSFDCAKADAEAEVLICSDEALAALDQRLAERYKATLTAIRALDTGQEAEENTLRTMQRGWIKGRNECWKADNRRACIELAYHTREAELVGKWMLEDPIAQETYTCEGNPANEVSVFFFATEVPGIRLEYGDSIRAGWQTPAASGSQYDLSFGGLFWLKGREALFRWGGSAKMTCVVSD